MLLMSLISAATMLAAQPASPIGQAATATLTAPREARLTLDGRAWACDPVGQCVGRGGGASQPLMRECRRFVGRFGPVSSFGRSNLLLTEAEVAQCNSADVARARRAPTA